MYRGSLCDTKTKLQLLKLKNYEYVIGCLILYIKRKKAVIGFINSMN